MDRLVGRERVRALPLDLEVTGSVRPLGPGEAPGALVLYLTELAHHPRRFRTVNAEALTPPPPRDQIDGRGGACDVRPVQGKPLLVAETVALSHTPPLRASSLVPWAGIRRSAPNRPKSSKTGPTPSRDFPARSAGNGSEGPSGAMARHGAVRTLRLSLDERRVRRGEHIARNAGRNAPAFAGLGYGPHPKATVQAPRDREPCIERKGRLFLAAGGLE